MSTMSPTRICDADAIDRSLSTAGPTLFVKWPIQTELSTTITG